MPRRSWRDDDRSYDAALTAICARLVETATGGRMTMCGDRIVGGIRAKTRADDGGVATEQAQDRAAYHIDAHVSLDESTCATAHAGHCAFHPASAPPPVGAEVFEFDAHKARELCGGAA
jgi:hypothetical protein